MFNRKNKLKDDSSTLKHGRQLTSKVRNKLQAKHKCKCLARALQPCAIKLDVFIEVSDYKYIFLRKILFRSLHIHDSGWPERENWPRQAIQMYVIAPLVAVLRMQCLLLGTLYVGPVPNGTLLTSLHFCGVSPLWLSGRSLTSIVDFSHAHTPAIVIPQDHKSIWNVPFGTIHIHSALHLKQCSQLFSVFIYFC